MYEHDHTANDPHPFAPYLAALGRGPGRSRPLTRAEARGAMEMVLDGRADPLQVGAFLLLLRYRHESGDEVAGMAEAIRLSAGLPATPATPKADLDWPSYAAGRTRGAPWFLLSALLCAKAGLAVAMHGFNSHLTNGTLTEEALTALGLPVAESHTQAQAHLVDHNFAYLPLRHLSATTQSLLALRPVLGLRTAVNTVVRALNPLDAPASFVGIFHPPYLPVQLEASKALGTGKVGIIKGGGGEAERNPFKASALNFYEGAVSFPPNADRALGPKLPKASLDHMLSVWRGETEDVAGRAVVTGTAAQALYLTGKASSVKDAESLANDLWDGRLS
ncbi:MAG: glycosyl transferase family protein [Alphaproteobacteria bacterium]